MLSLSETQVRNRDLDAPFPGGDESRWLHLSWCLECDRCLTIGSFSIRLIPSQGKDGVVFDSGFPLLSMAQLLIETAAQALLWAY